jgi:hypothetical protein
VRITQLVPFAVALVIAAATSTAAAQLLVEPISGVASRNYSALLTPGQPELDAGEDTLAAPGIGGGSTGHSLNSGSSEVRADSGAAMHYFSPSPGVVENVLRAQGHAWSVATVGSADGIQVAASSASRTQLAFRVTEPVAWTLDGTLAITQADGAGSGAAAAAVHAVLREGLPPFGHGTGVWALDEFAVDSFTLDGLGFLLPGDYYLDVSAAAFASSSTTGAAWAARAEYDVTLRFLPIPAPAAAAPLALAAGVAAMRRRRG